MDLKVSILVNTFAGCILLETYIIQTFTTVVSYVTVLYSAWTWETPPLSGRVDNENKNGEQQEIQKKTVYKQNLTIAIWRIV